MFTICLIIYAISMILAISGGALIGSSMISEDYPSMITGVILLIIAFILTIVVQFIPVKNSKKNRSEFKIVTDKAPNEIENIIVSYLKQNKFELGRYNDEDVYKNGAGLLVARKFLKYHIDDNEVIIEAWVSMMGVGWTPHKELPLDNSFLAAVPKKQLKKIIEKLNERL